jgi:predicted nucleic acid-binding protein
MIIALVDINIFEDVIRKRGNWEGSPEILERVRNKSIKGYISVLSIPLIYFLRKMPDKEAREKVRKITSGFEIIDLTSKIAKNAMNDENFNDFEDAIQFHSAIEKEINIIITRNKKDFRNVQDQIQILTPEEFIKD